VTPTGQRAAIVGSIAALALALVVPFFTSTTFIGDDHLFRTFARHAPNPIVPFVIDQHGGEYYRPLPMAVWWLLERSGGGRIPFAALALALHVTFALLVVSLLRGLERPNSVVIAGGALVLFAPQNLEAAYWFSASTDLFATVFVVGSLVALLRARLVASLVLAFGAYLSKESSFVLPVLALVVLRIPWRRRALLVAPHVAALTVVIVARGLVLRGMGATADTQVGALGKLVQLASGCAHVFTGQGVLPEVLAFGLGMAILALAFFTALRRPDVRSLPLAFAGAALLPLVATGWAVGARYFYLPSVGLAWAAAEALTGVGPAARATFAAALLLIGVGQAVQRRHDVASYDGRVAASRRAIREGVSAGHRIFHVDGGVKDLDLVIKQDPDFRSVADELFVLDDVPASFAIVPPALAEAAAVVVATPPVPPSGGYRFGDVRVVGLARRGDEPSLDEVVARFPDIRFLRLRPTPGGRIIARDMTYEIKQRLDLSGSNGQD
jgi:hypothetical protein